VVLYRFRDRRTIGRYAISVSGRSMAWSPDSRYVYGPEGDRDWRLDVTTGRLEEKVRSLWFPDNVDFAANDAGQLVVATAGGQDVGPGLNLIDWATGKEQWIAEGIFFHLAFGRNPNLFISAKYSTSPGDDSGVWLGRLRGGEWHLSRLNSAQASNGIVALSPDSKRLAYETRANKVEVVPIPDE
jgi:hypothetical protein